MGVVRSTLQLLFRVVMTLANNETATFAMCAAMLVRRKQLLLMGLEDPFASVTSSGFSTVRIMVELLFEANAMDSLPP